MQAESEIVRFNRLLAGFAGKRILVIGDLMLDEFIWGRVSRISPEAPVPWSTSRVNRTFREALLMWHATSGSFTDRVAVMGVTGADSHGRQLLDLLEGSGIDTSGVQRDAAFRPL